MGFNFGFQLEFNDVRETNTNITHEIGTA